MLELQGFRRKDGQRRAGIAAARQNVENDVGGVNALSDNFPHDLPRHMQVSANLLDRLLLDKIGAANLRNRFHNKHPNLGPFASRGQCGP